MGQDGPWANRLWRAYAGTARIDAIQPWCVIDNLDYGVRTIQFRTRDGGGVRQFGLRPLEPERCVREAQAEFFTNLRGSIFESGVKLPILLWGINGKMYVRYGASRLNTVRELGLTDTIPAVLCDYGTEIPTGFLSTAELVSPLDVLIQGFRSPSVVGEFRVDHERVDAHRMEP